MSTLTPSTDRHPRTALPRAQEGPTSRSRLDVHARLGVLLVVLIFGHLFVNLMLGEGIHGIDFAFVAGKFASPFWQWWDVLMLWLALIHGANGMRTIVNDYVVGATTRKVLVWALWIAAGFLILLGTLVVFTFDPCLGVENSTTDWLIQMCAAR
jgi:succinate dehydrogenase / fumarate reductase membrane anchor subunit